MFKKSLALISFLVLLAATLSAQDTKTTAAAMDLQAEEGVSQSVARMLSDYLRTQLVNTDKFIFVTRENVEEVLKEQKFQLSGCTDQECIVEVGKLLGVRKMFTGSIGKIGTTYVINLKVIDIQSGKIEKAETEKCAECKEESLINSIKKIVDKIIRPTSKEEQQENILGQVPGKSTVELNTDIDSYTKAIKLDPKDAIAYFNRGNAYYVLGQYQKAIDDFTRAIEIEPGDTLVYELRGAAYGRLGKYQKVIDDLNKAIKLNPKDANTYNSRGAAYCTLKKYQKAIDDYTKSIELNPKIAFVYCNRGNVYCVLGQQWEAIGDYTKAIELNPKNAYAYYSRGLTYVALGNPEFFLMAACDNFYQAGLLYLEQGNKTEALMCVGSIKKADPPSPLIKKLMDKIYEEQ